MVSFNEALFLMQLIIFLVATIIKILNTMNKGKIYSVTDKGFLYGASAIIILYMIIGLSWLFGLFIVMIEFDTWIYAQIFRLETLLLGLNTFLMIVEFLFMIPFIMKKPREAYKPSFD